MLENLKKNVVRPLAEMLGTKLAIALVPFGVHADSAEALALGIIGVGLVACDLVYDWLRRHRGAK